LKSGRRIVPPLSEAILCQTERQAPRPSRLV
jgi:hypothetical protein